MCEIRTIQMFPSSLINYMLPKLCLRNLSVISLSLLLPLYNLFRPLGLRLLAYRPNFLHREPFYRNSSPRSTLRQSSYTKVQHLFQCQKEVVVIQMDHPVVNPQSIESFWITMTLVTCTILKPSAIVFSTFSPKEGKGHETKNWTKSLTPGARFCKK